MKRPPTDKLAELYYRHGLSPREIAARVGGISVTGVRSRLVRAGHKLRSRGNWKGNFRRPKILTEDLLKAHRDGLNYTQIAKRFHTTRPTVAYRLRSVAGLARKHDPQVSQTLPWEEIIALYNGDGRMSVDKIAKRYGVGAQTINRGLHKRGVELRDKTAHTAATWEERKRKLAEFDRMSQPKRRGRPTEPEQERISYTVGQRVESEIPRGRQQDRLAIQLARRRVSEATRLSYRTVAEYHRDYRASISAVSANPG